jgi:NAD-dependent deacetylase
METQIRAAAQLLIESRCAVALTGAGISVESGIPPFRGKGGLWERLDPMQFAHIEAFRNDPEKVWRVLLGELQKVTHTARPNPAHRGLAELEQSGLLKAVITQNIDGLHQLAGNREVVEFHGTFAWQECMTCGQRHPTRDVDFGRIPPRCFCNGILRPAIVFFGEAIPMSELVRSEQLAQQCDLMLVIGTSATVQPAAFMPRIAKETGAKVIEINPEKTPLSDTVSDLMLTGPAGETMDRLMRAVRELHSA